MLEIKKISIVNVKLTKINKSLFSKSININIHEKTYRDKSDFDPLEFAIDYISRKKIDVDFLRFLIKEIDNIYSFYFAICKLNRSDVLKIIINEVRNKKLGLLIAYESKSYECCKIILSVISEDIDDFVIDLMNQKCFLLYFCISKIKNFKKVQNGVFDKKYFNEVIDLTLPLC